MNLEIDPYRSGDLGQCAKIVQDQWGYEEFFSNVKDPLFISVAEVKKCLIYASSRQVVRNEQGEVLGFLFGSIAPKNKREKRKVLGNLIRYYAWWTYHLVKGDFGRRLAAIKGFSQMASVDHSGEQYEKNFDGEILIFLIKEELRGKGFGKRLVSQYLDYCRAHKLKQIFLSTDYECDYQFYEKQGFRLYRMFYNKNLEEAPTHGANGFVYYYPLDVQKSH